MKHQAYLGLRTNPTASAKHGCDANYYQCSVTLLVSIYGAFFWTFLDNPTASRMKCGGDASNYRCLLCSSSTRRGGGRHLLQMIIDDNPSPDSRASAYLALITLSGTLPLRLMLHSHYEGPRRKSCWKRWGFKRRKAPGSGRQRGCSLPTISHNLHEDDGDDEDDEDEEDSKDEEDEEVEVDVREGAPYLQYPTIYITEPEPKYQEQTLC